MPLTLEAITLEAAQQILLEVPGELKNGKSVTLALCPHFFLDMCPLCW